jgi:hypothetical protein
MVSGFNVVSGVTVHFTRWPGVPRSPLNGPGDLMLDGVDVVR